MARIAALVSAGLGLVICVLGAAIIAGSQAMPVEESIFPLPGLILIDWAVIGVLGFISGIVAFDPHYQRLGRAVWIVVGALLPLMVLGALSIGPLVLASMLCFLVSAILVAVNNRTGLLTNLGYLFVGVIVNLVIILGLILLASLLNG